jgi:hypothetical protein
MPAIEVRNIEVLFLLSMRDGVEARWTIFVCGECRSGWGELFGGDYVAERR